MVWFQMELGSQKMLRDDLLRPVILKQVSVSLTLELDVEPFVLNFYYQFQNLQE